MQFLPFSSINLLGIEKRGEAIPEAKSSIGRESVQCRTNDVKSENDKEKSSRRRILGHRSCFTATIEGFERRKQTRKGFLKDFAKIRKSVT
ncbi:uncharacterized protein LOC110229881 [Arabidopsis lyrata subsp. lyrata]|uniref:uncharacterized protein LOC110229881 n=1 Tax=Arabidopsis lyrata subsp. lyrata TaxID=81972 RepID=UPI000A29D84A|nr:uncharacterized protein LOC110229881 [Arabidopsis lyrata subsp. lyrata]|eukprot:XP_020886634.1 uncharacterized protein LOC110229881 [Arabidopsis lyrata subsp. lyrata]